MTAHPPATPGPLPYPVPAVASVPPASAWQPPAAHALGASSMVPRHPPVIAQTLPVVAAPFAVTVAGCHGGAGATVIARLLSEQGQVGEVFMRPPQFMPHLPLRPVVLVARGHTDGARHATTAVNALRSRGMSPLALVVVADAPGTEPPTATARLRMLEPQVGALLRFPYISAWRYRDTYPAPALSELPKKAIRALATLTELARGAMDQRRLM